MDYTTYHGLRKIILSLLLCVACLSVQAQPLWKSLAPGIDYQDYSPPNESLEFTQHLYVFKIDLTKNQLKLAFAGDDVFPGETVKWVAERNHALLAVNGGFFTPAWHPIGLRIQDGKVRSPLHTTSWWHIFYIQDNRPHIIAPAGYQPHSDMTLAIQSGPRLLVDGQIVPALKPGEEERTALGITADGKIIIAATAHWPMTTTDLALYLKKLGCVQALNLDGGSSTQLYASLGSLRLNTGLFALVTDIVYVFEKEGPS